MWTYNRQSFQTLRECIECILQSLEEAEGSISVTYSQSDTRKTIRSLYYCRNDSGLKYDWIFTELEVVPGPWSIRLGSDHTILGGV